jgi:serine/threonine-protein kinase
MNIDDVLRQGTVFTTIDGHDSGCVAYGVDLGGERLFVKVPSTPAAAASLRRAANLQPPVRHPAVIATTSTAGRCGYVTSTNTGRVRF